MRGIGWYADAAMLGVWLAWSGLWCVLWFTTKPAIRRETLVQRAIHLTPVAAAMALLLSRSWQPALLTAYWLPPSAWQDIVGLAVTVAGLGFTIWARATIGRNWSATVTLKRGHELIRTGPYALVRHPIYTGFIAAMGGSAIALDSARGWLGVVLVVLCLIPKRRTEEQFMRAEFGAAYDEYAASVPALVPFTK